LSAGSISVSGTTTIDTTAVPGGGTFTVSGGKFVNVGTASLIVNGRMSMAGGTLSGGTLALGNAAQLTVTSASAWDGVTLDGDLSVPSGTYLTVTHGLTLNGTATLGSGPGYAALRFAGTQTLDGTGAVVFNSSTDSANALAVVSGGTTLTIGPGITVRG